ncbi:MAG: hypothetical protein ACRD1R_08255, partial [Acidobacteriota bacterium]
YGEYGQNFYNRGADYSVTSFHVPHDFKLTWIYDLPFGPQGRWLNDGVVASVLGGWTVSAIQRYRSGNPLRLTAGGYDGQALFNRQFRGAVLLPHDEWFLGDAPDDVNPSTGTPYLNPAAFGRPPATGNNVPIRLGTAPRWFSNLRGFPISSEDLSLIKRSALGFREEASFEIRMDVINLFNRVRLGSPSMNINNLNQFGRIFGKIGGPRIIQLGLRINF